VFGETERQWGGKLLPATLGRCDFSAADPVCRVSFVLQTSAGLRRVMGIEQAAVKRADGWRFLGNRLEVQVRAESRLVMLRRVDGVTATTPAPADIFRRYLDIAIPAVGALQCARVSQKDVTGADVPLAVYKLHASGRHLSLWTLLDGSPSVDPASGSTRGADIVALPLRSGAAGDTVARNFARVGRALKVELFSDTACATPLAGADGGSVSVDVAGQLPMTTAGAAGQPWPVLAAPAQLADLKGAVGAKVNYGPTWTFPRADVSVDRVQLCTLDPNCTNKLIEMELTGSATAAALIVPIGNLALAVKDYKLLRLTGRTSDGLVLQMDTASCGNQVVGSPC